MKNSFKLIVLMLLAGALFVSAFSCKKISKKEPDSFPGIKKAGETWFAEEGVRISGLYISPDIVELNDGTFKMFFAVDQGVAGSNGEVFSAISQDGLNWTKENGVRISNASSPAVLKLDDKYTMYFAGLPKGVSNSEFSFIMKAESGNGDIFKLSGSSAGSYVLSNEEMGEFENYGIKDPFVMKREDGTYKMYYVGISKKKYGSSGNLSGKSKMDLFADEDSLIHYVLSASSNDGLAWTKDAGVRFSGDSEVDKGLIKEPAVFYKDGKYKLYYRNADGIFLAESADGIKFDGKGLALPIAGNRVPEGPDVVEIKGVSRMYVSYRDEGILSAISE